MFKQLKHHSALTILFTLIFVISCNQADKVPQNITNSIETDPTEAALFTDADIDNASLQLASNDIAILGTEGEEVPDTQEVDLTLYEPTNVSTQAYLPGAKGKGCFIAFNPNANKPWKIWLVKLGAEKTQLIYSGKRAIDSVACNSDGSKFVFAMKQTTDPNSDLEIYKYDGTIKRLTNNSNDDSNVSGNDDLTLIAWERGQKVFYRDHNDPNAPDTFDQFILDHDRPQVEPSLGCGGLCIALVRLGGNGNYSVKLFNIGTNKYTHIHVSQKLLSSPSTDITGDKVVFLVEDNIVKIKEAGSATNVIKGSKTKSSPSISDDGKWLLLVISDELFLIDLDSGAKKKITSFEAASQAGDELSTQARCRVCRSSRARFAKTSSARLKVEKYFVDDDGKRIGTEHTIGEGEEAKLVIKATNIGNKTAYKLYVQDRLLLPLLSSPNYSVTTLPSGTEADEGDGFATTVPSGFIDLLPSGSHEWPFTVTADKEGVYCDLAVVGFAHNINGTSISSETILNATFARNDEFGAVDICLNVEKVLEEVFESLDSIDNIPKIENFSFELNFNDNLTTQANNPNIVYAPSSSTGSVHRINFTDPSNPIVESTYNSFFPCTKGVRSIVYRHIEANFSDPAYDAIIVSSFDERRLCIIPANFQGLVTTRSLSGAPAGMTPIPGSNTKYAYVDFENSKLVVFQGMGNPELHISLTDGGSSCPFNVIATATKAYVVGQEGLGTCNDHRGLFKVDIVNNTLLKELNFGTQPRGVALSPNGKRAYVADFAENVIYVINTTTMKVLKTISVGSGPVGVVVSSDGKYLITTNWNDNKVQAIDLATDTVIGSADTDENPAYVKFGPDGKTVLVSNFTGGSLGFYNFTPPTP